MEEEPKIKNFTPVKDYAAMNNISVQAVYDRIKAEKVEVKKIGTYTLVRDK
jgi:predicted DNA-binding protein YlxM (UPF0122 family)